MKRLFLAILFLTQLSNLSAQFSKEEKEILAIVDAQDSLPRQIFLDSTILVNMKVGASNTRQVWFSKGRAKADVEQVFDIRLKFESHQAALDFHQKYLNVNAEYGKEIKKHKMTSDGATAFHVYHGADMVNAMVEQYGFRMYCFIFVVDNYFAKVYVSCNIDFKPDHFQPLVTEAIKRIKSVK